MRRALAGDTEIQMPSLIRIAKREPKFEWRGRAGETSNPLFRGFGAQGEEAQRYDQPVLIRLNIQDKTELADGFPKSEEQLFGTYRAIILDDLEAEFFSQEQMHLIERFVSERGGALLMLGGQESFREGGYEHTPIGRLLPVYLDRHTQMEPVEDGRLNLSREGWLEPWLRLRPTQPEDEQRLAAMPGFWSANQTFSIKPGASVLATLTGENQNAMPALAAQRYGEGRVAALLIGDLWRWGMKDEAARQDMERTWRQLLRWLVVDVPDRLQVMAEPTLTSGRNEVKLGVRIRDNAFQPMDDVQATFEVTGPKGGKSRLYAEPSLKEPGLYEATYFSPESGAFTATATAEQLRPGQAALPLGNKVTGWSSLPTQAEWQSLAPNWALMEQVAHSTGGKVLKLDELSQLPQLLQNLDVPIKETLITPLWHTPWFFGLVIGLLGAEWLLRRRGGLP